MNLESSQPSTGVGKSKKRKQRRRKQKQQNPDPQGSAPPPNQPEVAPSQNNGEGTAKPPKKKTNKKKRQPRHEGPKLPLYSPMPPFKPPPLASPPPPSWPAARWIMRRLPLELQREIYSYTLAVDGPVAVLNSHPDGANFLPCPRSAEDLQPLTFSFAFLLTRRFGSNFNDAVAWLLRNNLMYVYSAVTARILVSRLKMLERGGHNVYLRNLLVHVGHDPTAPYIRNRINASSYCCDPADFKPTDGWHVGLRAYRVMKPLLALPKLGALTVVLQDRNYYGGSLIGVRLADTSCVFAGVIARLRETVLATPLVGAEKEKWEARRRFQVLCHNEKNDYRQGDGPDEMGERGDITYLWEPMAREEVVLIADEEEIVRQAWEEKDMASKKFCSLEGFVQGQLQYKLKLEPRLVRQYVVQKALKDPGWMEEAERHAVKWPWQGDEGKIPEGGRFWTGRFRRRDMCLREDMPRRFTTCGWMRIFIVWLI